MEPIPTTESHSITDRPDEDTSIFDILMSFGIVLGQHKRLLFGVPALAMVVAAVYSLIVPFQFSAVTTFLPPQQQQSTAMAALQQLGGLAGIANSAAGLRRPEDLYFALLRSQYLQGALIDRLDLMSRYEAQYRQNARDALSGNAKISVERGGLLMIEATDKEPEFAAKLANAHVEELRKMMGILVVTEAQQRRTFFEQQLLAAKDGLAKAEVALKQTQERTGLFALDRQGEAIIQAAANVRAQIVSREVQLQAMNTFATAHNPDVQRIASEISGLKSQLAKLEEGSMRGGSGIVPIGKVPEAGLEYVRAARDVKYQEAVFELLARQFELAKVDEAREGPVIQQVDVATVPEFRSSPKRKQMVLIAGAIGSVLAVILIFVLSLLRRSKDDPVRLAQFEVLRENWRLRRTP